MSIMAYSTIKRGIPNTTSYRLFMKDCRGPISTLHDVPLYADDSKFVYNVVILSPRWSNAKMKISIDEPLNPILQEEKDGQLSYIRNYFPHHGYIWNVGVFPQANRFPIGSGEGPPPELENVEIIEIGYRVAEVGDVIPVKILGTVGLKGEHIRVIGIDINDPLSRKLHDLASVNEHYPGLLSATTEWIEIQSGPEHAGKSIKWKAGSIVHPSLREMHRYWSLFVKTPAMAGNLSALHVCAGEPDYKIQSDEAEAIVIASPLLGKPAEVAVEVQAWLYDHIKSGLDNSV